MSYWHVLRCVLASLASSSQEKPSMGCRLPARRRAVLEALEDRRLLSVLADYGDAPEPYSTLAADTGAYHIATGPTLGTNRDSETDGLPSLAADGDDLTGTPNDEDGVTFGSIRVGQTDAIVTVNVQNAPGGAKLDAWIDFNGDGSWDGPSEQIADCQAVLEGDNLIRFDVPSWAVAGETYGRLRLSTAGNLAPGGAANDGEVEDYLVSILPPAQSSGCFVPRQETASADGVSSVYSADLDGDLDVLTAFRDTPKIAWYENTGGGTFGDEQVITTEVLGAESVFAVDLDGDGDQDVLSASHWDDKIAWYENTGGGTFGTQQVITTDADGAAGVFSADLDGDGDLDVVSASVYDDKIAWYENMGGGSFGAQHVITTTADGALSVFAADLDRDGDLDVLSASVYGNKIAWYENTGGGQFGTQQVIATDAQSADSVFAADLDGDGDMDVLSASWGDDKIAWYENMGDGAFGNQQVVTTDAGAAECVFAADLDGDGDLDVLSASSGDDKIAWYENDGSGAFGLQQIITSDASDVSSVFAADLDSDGDLDVLPGLLNDGEIAWFENVGFDFGDAPSPYPTLVDDGGAAHKPIGPTLGSLRDDEQDGQPTADADGDDVAGTLDDEDGVTTTPFLAPGIMGTTLTVDASEPSFLNAWIDFDRNGIWEWSEHVIVDHPLVGGTNTLLLDVPLSAVAGLTYARLRLTSYDTGGRLSPTGPADDGEVEDYAWTIENDPPTAVTLTPAISSLAENSDTSSSVKVADITISDDGWGMNQLALSGLDASSFLIVDGTQGKELHVAAGVLLDYEAQASYAVTVSVDDATVGTTPDGSATFTLDLTDVNESPSGLIVSPALVTLPENSDVSSSVKVADIAVIDDALGTNQLALSGPDASAFVIVDGAMGEELHLAAGVVLDYEGQASYSVTVSVDDVTVGSTPDVEAIFTLHLTDVNEPPSALIVSPAVVTLPENSDVSSSVKVADIAVIDDALGTNQLALSGDDASAFVIVDCAMGKELHLAAGVALDYEGQASYAVTVSVDDVTVGSTPDGAATFALNLANTNEHPSVNAPPGLSANEGSPLILSECFVVDPDVEDHYTVSVDWGDGSPAEPVTVSYLPSVEGYGTVAAVEAQHAYADNGTFTVTISVEDSAGATASGALEAVVANIAPEATIAGISRYSVRNTPLTATGSFVDPGYEDTHTFQWNVSKDGGSVFSGSEDTLTFTPEIPGAYTITLSVSDDDGGIGIANQELLVLESLGIVDFLEVPDAAWAGHESWYRMETTHAGLLTLLSRDVPATFELYDLPNTLTPLATSTGDGPRIDWPVDAGETYYLRLESDGGDLLLQIANLVQEVDSLVKVAATVGEDNFEFNAAESYRIAINGIAYDYGREEIDRIEFDGSGNDTAMFGGSTEPETARLFPDHGTFGENGFLVSVSGVKEITAHGGGGADSAFLYDSPGNDEFISRKGYGKLSGDGFLLETLDFMTNYGYATTSDGGSDTAFMEDTPTADKFKFDWPKPGQFFGKMYGGGVYYNRAKNFEQIIATMTDGKDMVRLFDSEGDDTFYGQKEQSRMVGPGYDVTASGYSTLAAYASTGLDMAQLEDSEDDDTTRARPHKITLWGGDAAEPTYEIMARRFDEYHFEGKHGGFDRAKLHDTVLNDHVKAAGNSASLYINDSELDLLYQVAAFEWVRLYATDNGGQDTLDEDDLLDFDLIYDETMWEKLP